MPPSRTSLSRLPVRGLIAACILVACSPTRIPAVRVPFFLSEIGKDHGFLTGLAFFEGRLFVGSSSGLFIVNDLDVEALLLWKRSFPGVDGPWLDAAHQGVWLNKSEWSDLLFFDGKAWHGRDWPAGAIPAGRLNSDFLAGSVNDFWLVGTFKCWRWNSKRDRFDEIADPPWPKGSRVVAFAGGRVFGITDDERLLERTKQGDVELATPGPCEAIAGTVTGRLVASFRAHGVYEYDGNWRLLFPSPPRTGTYTAFLAARDDAVAYGRDSPAGLWLWRDGRLSEVRLPR